jgi:hypothetical protein
MKKYHVIVIASVSNLPRHKVEVVVETGNIEHLSDLAAHAVKRYYFIPTDNPTFEVSSPETRAFFGGLDQRLTFQDGTGTAWIMGEHK